MGAGGEGTGGRAVGGPPASADVRAHLTLSVGLAPHVLFILPIQSHFIQCGQNGCGVSGDYLNCVCVCLERNGVLAVLSLCPEASVTAAIGHPSFSTRVTAWGSRGKEPMVLFPARTGFLFLFVTDFSG